MTIQIRVVGAVFVRGGSFLACRRAPGRADAGFWEFPGGKINAGETPEEALRREIVEELGVTVDVGARVDRSTTIVGNRSIDVECRLVRTADAIPTSSTDHDQLVWVDRESLSELSWSLPDVPTVKRLTSGASWPETVVT